MAPALTLEEQLQRALEALRRGGVVALPTDTLYGLAADPFNEGAVERVFDIKGRPLGMPLPLLLAGPEQLPLVVASVTPGAEALARRFWPGALTLVLPKHPRVPALVTARGWTVAVRVPAHPVPRELALRLGRPITGTSANRSGEPACTSAEEVRRRLGAAVDLVLEGGPRPSGMPSTVVDLTGPYPRLVRLGAVSLEELEGALGTPLRKPGEE